MAVSVAALVVATRAVAATQVGEATQVDLVTRAVVVDLQLQARRAAVGDLVMVESQAAAAASLAEVVPGVEEITERVAAQAAAVLEVVVLEVAAQPVVVPAAAVPAAVAVVLAAVAAQAVADAEEGRLVLTFISRQ